MTTTPTARSDAEAQTLLAEELEHLSARREALGEAGVYSVAAWRLQMAMEFEAAALAWHRAHELAPERPEPVHGEALCRLELGQWDRAADLYRLAIEVDAAAASDPDAETLDWEEQDPAFGLGMALHAAGELEAALEAYEVSAARNMIGVEALHEQYRCLMALGRPQDASAVLDRMERRTARLSVRATVQALRAEVGEALQS